MDLNIFAYIIVGFIAQLIDGALGMAYGVSSTTFLLSLGVSPAVASASVHTAEVFTTAVSGASHWKLGNVDKQLVKRLLIPGVLGGIVGAYILTSIPANVIKPFIAFYLVIMGIRILWKVIKRSTPVRTEMAPKRLIPLASAGGFFDAIGGGGWGPIVTSTLVANGHHPRFTIGSVNLSEFFVTLAEAATFFTLLGVVHWQVIVGLLIGGVLAAPMAAFACKKIPCRALMLIVGLVITGLSVRTIFLALA
jgi:uncharacterized membrane protein YfcA